MFSPQFVKIIVKDIEDILLAKSCKGWGEWRVNSKFLICSYPLDARCKLKQKTFNWSPEQFFLCLMCIRFPTQISHVWYSTTLTMSFDIYLLLTNKEAQDNWKNLNLSENTINWVQCYKYCKLMLLHWYLSWYWETVGKNYYWHSYAKVKNWTIMLLLWQTM